MHSRVLFEPCEKEVESALARATLSKGKDESGRMCMPDKFREYCKDSISASLFLVANTHLSETPEPSRASSASLFSKEPQVMENRAELKSNDDALVAVAKSALRIEWFIPARSIHKRIVSAFHAAHCERSPRKGRPRRGTRSE